MYTLVYYPKSSSKSKNKEVRKMHRKQHCIIYSGERRAASRRTQKVAWSSWLIYGCLWQREKILTGWKSSHIKRGVKIVHLFIHFGHLEATNWYRMPCFARLIVCVGFFVHNFFWKRTHFLPQGKKGFRSKFNSCSPLKIPSFVSLYPPCNNENGWK